MVGLYNLESKLNSEEQAELSKRLKKLSEEERPLAVMTYFNEKCEYARKRLEEIAKNRKFYEKLHKIGTIVALLIGIIAAIVFFYGLVLYGALTMDLVSILSGKSINNQYSVSGAVALIGAFLGGTGSVTYIKNYLGDLDESEKEWFKEMKSLCEVIKNINKEILEVAKVKPLKTTGLRKEDVMLVFKGLKYDEQVEILRRAV